MFSSVFFRVIGTLFAICSMGATLSFAQVLTGTVYDEDDVPFANVNVTLPALNRGTTTHLSGEFKIEKLPVGIYMIQFDYLGYRRETRIVDLSMPNTSLKVFLQPSPLEMPALIVTAKPQPTDVLRSPQAVSVLEGRRLDRLRGQSLMASIEKSPGVSTYTTGAGVVKPVIRGLTSQRVLVMANGIRQEGQQWGDEHGIEMDAFDVDRIEVVRGPQSVLYGSDALGGVINVIKADIPSSQLGAPTLGGHILANGFSNNRSGAGALSLYGARGDVGYRVQASMRDAQNIRTPQGALFNSGMYEQNGSGLVGWQGAWGSTSVDYSHFDQKIQIHENPAEVLGATPYQKVQHDKVHFHGNFLLPRLRLEVDGGWQANDRKEFEEKDAREPELHLVLNTTTLDLKGHHQPLGAVFGTLGFSAMHQKNTTRAEEALIPASRLINLAGFVYEEMTFHKLSFSTGLRFDWRTLQVENNETLGIVAQTRDDGAVAGTAGVVWRVIEPLALAVNVGRGWRAPTAFELFVQGVHEGTVRYEMGDHALKPEQSLNLDLSIRYASNRVQGEMTFFQNRLNRYIFLIPTGEVDAESGFDKYAYEQADASMLGAELNFQAQIVNGLILEGGVDFVRGTNHEIDRPLPLVPASRIQLGTRLTTASLGKFKDPYLSLGVMRVGAQNRVAVFETKTEGYVLWDLGGGVDVPFRGLRMRIDGAIENLFNKAYRGHLSRYKAYALNQGRNMTLKASVPFTLSE